MGYFKLIWLHERRNEIINHIKELEHHRVDHDLLNINKCEPLYEVLDKINKAIEEESDNI